MQAAALAEPAHVPSISKSSLVARSQIFASAEALQTTLHVTRVSHPCLRDSLSSSIVFELLEWGAAELVGGDLGMACLGTQGDVWDAHKDMALASLGALIAMTATAGINFSLQRDFAREWAESLKVKRREPLGEYELRQMLETRDRQKP